MNTYCAFQRMLAIFMVVCPGLALAADFSVYDIPTPFIAEQGQSVKLSAWRGRPAIVTMEYANCRFICTITLRRLKDVQQAADRNGVTYDFIVISLDPKNDTPAEWQHYRATKEIPHANWHFLTAAVDATPAVARYLGVKYWLYDEHIMHDFRLLRVDAAGHVVRVMDTYDASSDEFVR